MPDQIHHISNASSTWSLPEGRQLIMRITARWNRNRILQWLVKVTALTLVLTAVSVTVFNAPWWTVAAALVVSISVLLITDPMKKIRENQVISYLNSTVPELEESAQLVLAESTTLTSLQLIQQQRTLDALSALTPPAIINKPVKKAGFMLLGALLLASAIVIAGNLVSPSQPTSKNIVVSPRKIKERIPAGIASYEVRISPPPYTGRPTRSAAEFALTVEDGSMVTWTINTTVPLESVTLRFNNKTGINLKPLGKDSSSWTFSQRITSPGFYQVYAGDKPSPLYRIEVIPDKPVQITIASPQQYSNVQPGQPAFSTIKVNLADDYSISSAGIVATRASGKGEAVSFKELELSFAQPVKGQQNITLLKTLDLAALGLQSGDELYFYIKASDSRGQESRSDMYFISMPDTEELLNMSGLTAGVDKAPDYFRSQRQIILDTEKLLKEQGSIPKDSFNLRSNELGNDQKLLRLRYGKFLGEENETGGHSADDGHDHSSEPAEYGNVKALMDQIGHKHDNAEDPNFFEPQQKAALKAVLTEMWSSELKLRTYLPAQALPFEYKALKLLKDLQQKSRAYVSKTATGVTALRQEKRLTADLSKIEPATARRTVPAESLTRQALRRSASILEKFAQGTAVSNEEQAALIEAERAIAEHAVQSPGEFLEALGDIRSISKQGKATKQQVRTIQSAIRKILKENKFLPQSSPSGSALSDQYFRILKQQKQ